jgi:hypothetical protein
MSDHGTNLYTAQRIAQHRLDEAARRAEHARTTSIARQPRSTQGTTTANSTRWAVTAAMVAGVMITAACGTDTTSPTPANPPVQARIYPPTDVPEVRPGFMSADAAERRMAQNEEKLRRAGGNTTDSSACNWTVEQLPRTPDAVEGRYHDC